MRELISLFRELIGKRKLVTELAKADFRKRFVGSYFGIVWMFIQPMVTIAIYAFIFGEHGMKMRRRFRGDLCHLADAGYHPVVLFQRDFKYGHKLPAGVPLSG